MSKREQLIKLKVNMEQCMACFQGSFSNGETKRVSIPRGDWKATIMFIGQGPSLNYEGKGVAFERNGNSWKVLHELIRYLGFPKYYLSNIIKCSKPHDFLGNKYYCAYFLQREIDFIQPKIIVTLGNEAFQQVVNSGQFRSFYGANICPIPHPMTVHYGRYTLERYIELHGGKIKCQLDKLSA